MSSKMFKRLNLLLLFLIILSLTACSSGSGTRMEFSFNTKTPADSYDEKFIYTNEDMDLLILNAELKIDTGEVTIQVQEISNDEIVWSENFNKDTSFSIELTDIKADSEYLINIQSTQSQKVNLVITSNYKLVQNKEKPERYSIDK